MTPKELKKLRATLGISQPKLARLLECSPRYITYREMGERKIKKILEYAVKYLLHCDKIKDK